MAITPWLEYRKSTEQCYRHNHRQWGLKAVITRPIIDIWAITWQLRYVEACFRGFRSVKAYTSLWYWASLWENRLFAYATTKPQISCAVTAQQISAFVLATRIVQSLFYLNPKFQASSCCLWVYSLVCVRPGRKPRRPVFSQRGSY